MFANFLGSALLQLLYVVGIHALPEQVTICAPLSAGQSATVLNEHKAELSWNVCRCEQKICSSCRSAERKKFPNIVDTWLIMQKCSDKLCSKVD